MRIVAGVETVPNPVVVLLAVAQEVSPFPLQELPHRVGCRSTLLQRLVEPDYVQVRVAEQCLIRVHVQEHDGGTNKRLNPLSRSAPCDVFPDVRDDLRFYTLHLERWDTNAAHATRSL